MNPSRILCWNVRGLNSRVRQDAIRNLISNSRVDIVCLQETKMSVMSVGVILSSMGSDFTNWIDLPAAGASGGIVVAWRQCLGPALATRVDNYSLSIQFSPGSLQPWWLTCVYGPQGDINKLLFMQKLRDVRSFCQGPWTVLGDFNLTTSALQGRKFTWSNQQDNPTLVKLDRVFCSSEWEQLFPNCLLQSSATEGSDHCPLLLGLHDVQPAKARFHFESFWPTLEGFQEAVESAWSAVQATSCPFDTSLSLQEKSYTSWKLPRITGTSPPWNFG